MTYPNQTADMKFLAALVTPFITQATSWVEKKEALILAKGRALTPSQKADAVKAGVAHPEKIRIEFAHSIRPPKQLMLGFASRYAHALGQDTAGLTLRYGIFIRNDCQNYRAHRELYIHEFCHVAQYERYGSIQAFLTTYLQECLIPGYPNGSLEQEAILGAAKIVRGA